MVASSFVDKGLSSEGQQPLKLACFQVVPGNMKRNPLPSKAETLLLQASLLEGRAAVSAFYAWRQGLNLDVLNSGSQRVLPLLCRKSPCARD